MTTLYEITSEHYELLRRLASEELTEEERTLAMEAAANMERDTELKLSNICAVVKNWKADIEALKTERARLAEAIEVKERKIERLCTYVTWCKPDLDRWTNGVHKLYYLQAKAAEPSPDNPNATVPDQFANIKIVKTPDKKLIKQTFEEGGSVPGWHVVERKHLQVK